MGLCLAALGAYEIQCTLVQGRAVDGDVGVGLPHDPPQLLTRHVPAKDSPVNRDAEQPIRPKDGAKVRAEPWAQSGGGPKA